ncbi:MAG: response regulator [Caldilineae bacterium]|nr:MAG: response regulator [Caldilineae bacterium]
MVQYARQQEVCAVPSGKPLRIVIAEDEGIICLGLKAMLRSLGHRVVATAGTGIEAVACVKAHHPDLLLLDLNMPEMDGLTAARILAEEHPLPILLLTGYAPKERVEETALAPVMGWLVKPVDETRLAPALEVAVARFAERAAAAERAARLKQQLADHNLIRQAKRLLMAQGLSEDEAYHKIQAGARRRQITLAEQALRIIKRGGI